MCQTDIHGSHTTLKASEDNSEFNIPPQYGLPQHPFEVKKKYKIRLSMLVKYSIIKNNYDIKVIFSPTTFEILLPV
jgi:hypothetical protein